MHARIRNTLVAASMATMTLLTSAALAQPGDGGAGYGPGMMYGPGPGMMGGSGPGMMGGSGPGMMGGYGPGYGRGQRGPGYGGGAALERLDLTSEQWEQVLQIQEDTRQKNWDTMGRMRSEAFKLRRLYSADTLDTNGITEQQRKVDELRLAMMKSRLDARKRVEAVLTPEQRKQMRRLGPWWMQEDDTI